MVINYEIRKFLGQFDQSTNNIFESILDLEKEKAAENLKNETNLDFNFDFNRQGKNAENTTILSSRIKIDAFDHVPRLQRLKFTRENDYLFLDDNIFFNLKNLTFLELKFRIGQIREKMFAGLANLKNLILNGCNLNSIEDGSFKDLANLDILDLSHNNNLSVITSKMFDGLANLKQLKLNDCKITTISGDTFRIFNRLESLNLSSNQIKKIDSEDFCVLTNLTRLDLSSCPINSIDENAFSSLKNLKYLYLSNSSDLSNINGETFSKLKNLTRLHMDECGLEQKAFDSLPFRNLTNLTEIVLKSNNLVKIKSDLLENSKKLKKVCLRNANLSELEQCFFENLKSLNQVDLAGNSLSRDQLELIETKLRDKQNFKYFCHFLTCQEEVCDCPQIRKYC